MHSSLRSCSGGGRSSRNQQLLHISISSSSGGGGGTAHRREGGQEAEEVDGLQPQQRAQRGAVQHAVHFHREKYRRRPESQRSHLREGGAGGRQASVSMD